MTPALASFELLVRRAGAAHRGLARPALGFLALLAMSPLARAQPVLLGTCAELVESRCVRGTPWSLAQSPLPPALDAPQAAAAGFAVTVVEGESLYLLETAVALELTGLEAAGTRVLAIAASVQRGEPGGGFTTVASAAAGDPAALCECPFVDGDALTLSLPAVPFDLAYAETRGLRADLRFEAGAALVPDGAALRVQTCVAFVPAGESALGCHADGGAVRTVRSCVDVPGECALEQQAPALTLALGTVAAPIASLGAFAAGATEGPLTPPGPLAVTPGGPLVGFALARTGVPGTVSMLALAGTVSCQPVPVCAGAGPCTTELGHTAALAASPTWPFASAPLAGSPAAAAVLVSCPKPPPRLSLHAWLQGRLLAAGVMRPSTVTVDVRLPDGTLAQRYADVPISAAGQVELGVAGVPAGDYHVVVRHLNHLAIRSAATVAFPPAAPLDLTLPAQVQGAGALTCAGARCAMRAGDVDQDGYVGNDDLHLIVDDWNTAAARSDLDGDGRVFTEDKALWRANFKEQGYAD